MSFMRDGEDDNKPDLSVWRSYNPEPQKYYPIQRSYISDAEHERNSKEFLKIFGVYVLGVMFLQTVHKIT